MSVLVEVGTPADGAEIERALLRVLAQQQTQARNTRFDLVCRGADGTLVAGLSASTSYGWLLIKTLWVADDLRRAGHGRALVACAEEMARDVGCHAAWLDTSSAGARAFYAALGYTPFGQLDNGPGEQPPDHTRWFLRKSLVG